MGKVIERVRQREDAAIRREVERWTFEEKQQELNRFVRSALDALYVSREDEQAARDQLVTGVSVQVGGKRVDPATMFPEPTMRWPPPGCPECGWGKVAGCWRCGSR